MENVEFHGRTGSLNFILAAEPLKAFEEGGYLGL